MTLRFLNPSHEAQAQAFAPAPRPASLAGATVGFISNGKEGTRGFFAHLEALLRERLDVGEVRWRTKNSTAPLRANPRRRSGMTAITGLGD